MPEQVFAVPAFPHGPMIHTEAEPAGTTQLAPLELDEPAAAVFVVVAGVRLLTFLNPFFW